MAAKRAYRPVPQRVTVGRPGMLSQCLGLLVFARRSKENVLEPFLALAPHIALILCFF